MTKLGRIPVNQQNNPGKARWCEEHNRLECTKNRKRGRGECHMAAIRGTDTCRLHGGYSRHVLKAQGEAKITAWSPEGQPSGLDTGMAVMSVLQMTYLRLGAYSEMLRRQVAVEGLEAGTEVDPVTGLIGYRYGAAGKDGNIYRQSEEIRALVNLEAQERDRVVKYAKTAHDMGISARLTALAENWGELVATRISAMLDSLNLSPEQQAAVPHLLRLHLSSIDTDAVTQLEGPKK